MAKFAVALAALTTVADAGGVLALTFTDCGDASTHGKTTDIEPKSITLGDKAHIVGTGSVDEAVTGGSFEMKLNAAGIIKEDFKGDICKASTFDIKALGIKVGSVSWNGLACPLAAGAASVPMDVMLSSSLPASITTSDLSLTATTTSGDKLLCVNLHMAKQTEVSEAAVDCTKATCPTQCECTMDKCKSSVDSCLADATCAKGQACALGCACHDDACALQCAKDAASPLAFPVALCLKAQCDSAEEMTETAVDCTKATCPTQCECTMDKCKSSVDSCLADATCAKGQTCALSCACHDDACALQCAKDAASPLALPVALCIKAQCDSSSVQV